MMVVAADGWTGTADVMAAAAAAAAMVHEHKTTILDII